MSEKRLSDYFVELQKSCKMVERQKKRIKKTLYHLMSAQDKSFEVTLDGRVYDFYVPFTLDEHAEMEALRSELIDNVIQIAFKTSNWDFVTVYAAGADPKYLQIEIVKEESYEVVAGGNAQGAFKIPLDELSYFVQNERRRDDDVESVESMDPIETDICR